mmetsp:Transcript_21664/g.45388  ORF Transcript_21664/g.45388 Transcript_21664/m.45388 type:complete len:221 (-) Transcript_21664:300-962(-)
MSHFVGVLVVYLILTALEIILKVKVVVESTLRVRVVAAVTVVIIRVGIVVVVVVVVVFGAQSCGHAVLLVAVGVAVGQGIRVILVARFVARAAVGLALVLLLLHLPCNVGLKEVVHIHHVLSVVTGASCCDKVGARVSGTKLEANEALGSDAAVRGVEDNIIVLVVVGFICLLLLFFVGPLRDVITSDELDGVARDEADIFFGVVSFFYSARLVDEVTAE